MHCFGGLNSHLNAAVCHILLEAFIQYIMESHCDNTAHISAVLAEIVDENVKMAKPSTFEHVRFSHHFLDKWRRSAAAIRE